MNKLSTLNLLSVKTAADRLGVSVTRVQQFCREGRIGQKVGYIYVITAAELDQFAKIPREPGNPNWKKQEVVAPIQSV